MPTPVRTESSSTTAAAWKKLFDEAPADYHNGLCIRNKRGNSEDILVAIVPTGADAPEAVDATDDEKYSVSPGDTYPLGVFANYQSDVYVRGASDGVVTYNAWRVKGVMM